MKWVDPQIETPAEDIVSAVNSDVDPDVSFEERDRCYIWTYHYKPVNVDDESVGLWDDLHEAHRVVTDWLVTSCLTDGHFEIRLFGGTLRLREDDGNLSLNTKRFAPVVQAISDWMWRRGLP